VTAAVFFVLLLFLPEGDVCSTLSILVPGYAAFSITVTAVAGAWPRRRPIEGRARLYRGVAERCREAAGRYPFAGDGLRREAGYYHRKMRREMNK
jgi:hypothetical protein